jgi:hypothetical protein
VRNVCATGFAGANGSTQTRHWQSQRHTGWSRSDDGMPLECWPPHSQTGKRSRANRVRLFSSSVCQWLRQCLDRHSFGEPLPPMPPAEPGPTVPFRPAPLLFPLSTQGKWTCPLFFHLNQSQFVHNHDSQLVTEYLAHEGSVNTSTTAGGPAQTSPDTQRAQWLKAAARATGALGRGFRTWSPRSSD